ncbi:MAG: DUF3794 domain-containing protein [Christensenellales bacterium]|jgi:hypothetical protein
MDFLFEKIKSDSLQALESQQSVVESALSEAASEGITQILSLSAEAKVLAVEAVAGEARVTGRVNFKLLYLSEDEPKSLDIFADFTERVAHADITPSLKLTASMTVIDAETDRTTFFKLRAVVETTVCLLIKKEKECLTGAEAGVHAEGETARLTEHIGTANVEVELSEEEAAGGCIGRVLMLDAAAIVSNVKTAENVVMVSGMAEMKVLYTVDDATKSLTFAMPFDEEVAIQGVSLTDLATAKVSIDSARVVLTGEEKDNIIRAELRLNLRVDAFMLKERMMVKDVFSLEKELELGEDSLEIENLVGTRYFTDDLSGIAMLGEGKPAAREVVGVMSGRNQLASVVAGEATLTAEGLITATVIYLDENGLASVQIEIPYSFVADCDIISQGSKLQIDAAAFEITARVKRDKEIEVHAKLALKVDVFVGKTITFVSKVTEGLDKKLNTSTISVYIANEGDSIWDAVKALSATPEEIKKQNPGLVLPFREGDRVIFFRHISV